MGMVHEERDRGAVASGGLDRRVLVGVSGGDPVDVVVELDQEQRLVLHVREEVVFADEVEYARTAELEEVRERLARLTVQNESGRERT